LMSDKNSAAMPGGRADGSQSYPGAQPGAGSSDMATHGLDLTGSDVIHNAEATVLYEHAIRNGEGQLVASGALAVDTGVYTGRSPEDKFVVRNAATAEDVDWGKVNQPLAQASFDALLADMQSHLRGKRLYVQDVQAGTPAAYRLNVRVVTEYAWHSLFTKNLFIDVDGGHDHVDWVVVDLPSFKADPQRHGSASSTVVAMDFARKLVLIGNTEYGGEIKKSIFTALSLDLPRRSV